MASNGLMFRAGRGPSFILVGLVVVVIVLFYSYWGVSSKNNKLLRDVSVLQDRLRVLAARKLASDKKSAALGTQLTQMQDEKGKIERVIKSKEEQIIDANKILHKKEQELTDLHSKEKMYYEELAKLRQGLNDSSSALRLLRGKGELLLKKHEEIKANHSSLLEKISKLIKERDQCKDMLSKMKLEQEQAKKAKEATTPPRVTDKAVKKSTSRVKITSVQEEESEPDLPEDGTKASKERKTALSLVKGNASEEVRISSPTKNISSEVQRAIQQSGNKSSNDSGELKPANQSSDNKHVRDEDESEVKIPDKDDEIVDHKNSEDDGNNDNEEEKEGKALKRENEESVKGDDKEKTGEEDGDVNDGQDKDDDNEGDEAQDSKVEEKLDSHRLLPRLRHVPRPDSKGLNNGQAAEARKRSNKMMPGILDTRGMSRGNDVKEEQEGLEDEI